MQKNLLITRCLALGVQILPVFLSGVLNQYKEKRVPDAILKKYRTDKLTKYIKALHLTACENADDWSRGHLILEELGFKRIENRIGHRIYITLVYEQQT